MPVDLLAIAAHRDDVELTCAGTLLKAVAQGYRTGVVDLTAGETATKGSAEIRAREAEAAASVLGLSERRNLGMPDAGIHHTEANRKAVVEAIRELKPKTVILPYPVGRHPDHRIASELIRDACFLAGLAKYSAGGEPHRPSKLIYSMTYREDPVKPSFLVDISDFFEKKLEAIRCYQSQFEGAIQAGEVYPNGMNLLEVVKAQHAHYGTLIRKLYAEPFYTPEAVQVDDVVTMGVATF
jgi:N-acetylglucosamine malate deacetylase 1